MKERWFMAQLQGITLGVLWAGLTLIGVWTQ